MEEVDFARPAESSAALLVRVGVGRTKELASVVGYNILNVVEDVTLEDSTGAGITSLEQVTLDVEPDVVHGVKEGLAAKGRATASSLGDVVVLHGDGVASANHLENPVVVAVTTSGVVGGTVDEVAGEGDASAGCKSENIVLSAWASGLA